MKEFLNGVLLADVVDTDMSRPLFSGSGAPWMELAVLIMVGLMVMFAAFAIFFIYRQKKKDERDEQLRKEEERKENV